MTAPIGNYDDLVEGLVGRKAALGLSDAALDDLIGWASGYAGKVLAPAQVKRMGMQSLFELLAGLGLQIVLVEDAAATERIRRNGSARIETNVRPGFSRVSRRMKSRLMSDLGKSGAAARNANMPSSWHKENMARAGKARMAKLGRRGRRQLAIKAAVQRWRKKAQKEEAQAARKALLASLRSGQPAPQS